MTTCRYVQNFSQRRALIVSTDARLETTLVPTLRKLGMEAEHLAVGADETIAMPAMLEPALDVVFVEGNLARPLEQAIEGANLPAVPVIGLIATEAPSRLRALMQAGATAFLTKPVYGGAVFSALYLGVNEFIRKAGLRADVEELEARRRQRRHVIKAVLITMRERGVDDDEAFAELRRESMRLRVSVEHHCEHVARNGAAPTDCDASPHLRQAQAD